jgi:uncharacterized membrane protein YbaN (DUF454 family)
MDVMPDRPQTGPPSARAASPRRWLLAGAGVLAVALGGIGVFVPGLPTTIFLIIASYCFARSCPWLEDRLLRVPLFAPYMRFIDERRPMSARARAISITAMWTSVLLSLAWLRASGRLSAALAVTIVGIAAIGTLAVLRFRRAPRPGAVASESCSS